MAQLKSTTITGNLTVSGTVNLLSNTINVSKSTYNGLDYTRSVLGWVIDHEDYVGESSIVLDSKPTSEKIDLIVRNPDIDTANSINRLSINKDGISSMSNKLSLRSIGTEIKSRSVKSIFLESTLGTSEASNVDIYGLSLTTTTESEDSVIGYNDIHLGDYLNWSGNGSLAYCGDYNGAGISLVSCDTTEAQAAGVCMVFQKDLNGNDFSSLWFRDSGVGHIDIKAKKYSSYNGVNDASICFNDAHFAIKGYDTKSSSGIYINNIRLQQPYFVHSSTVYPTDNVDLNATELYIKAYVDSADKNHAKISVGLDTTNQSAAKVLSVSIIPYTDSAVDYYGNSLTLMLCPAYTAGQIGSLTYGTGTSWTGNSIISSSQSVSGPAFLTITQGSEYSNPYNVALALAYHIPGSVNPTPVYKTALVTTSSANTVNIKLKVNNMSIIRI